MQLIRSSSSKTALRVLLMWAIAPILGLAISGQTNLISDPRAVTVAADGGGRGSTPSEVSDEILKRMTPIFGFEQEGDSPALVLAKLADEAGGHHPAILVSDPGGWRLLDMDDEAFDQSTWVYAGATIDRRHVWGLIDMDVEDPGWELSVVFSSDSGRSWRHISTISKPIYLALFDSFGFASGRAWLTVHMEYDPYPSGRASIQSLKGYYTYYTRDVGRYWSGPRFSARRPRRSRTAPIRPSYTASSAGQPGIDDLKALMARLEQKRAR